MSRLRLLKVIVQPVLVLDDGERLIEQPVQPQQVSPQDWPNIVQSVAEGIRALQQQLDADGGDT